MNRKLIAIFTVAMIALSQSALASIPRGGGSYEKSSSSKMVDYPTRKAFSNLGISLDGSVAGVGVTLSTPLARHFVVRGGYHFSPFKIRYSYDDFESMSFFGINFTPSRLDLEGNLKMGSAHFMVDWVPFKKGRGSFFITAGVYAGSGDILDVDGQFDMSSSDMQLLQKLGLLDKLEFDVGDMIFHANSDGSMSAKLTGAAVRPYVGLGWGRAIPYLRFGFRFEIGATYHNTPEIISENLVPCSGENCSDGIYEVIEKVTFLPQLSFQLTYRIFKDK